MVNHPNRSKRLDKDTRLVKARAADFEAKRAQQQARHTPGPWTFDDNMGCRDIRGADGKPIASTHGLANDDEDQANARLIAAAPELLAALKTALKCIEYCREHHPDAQSGTGFPVEIELRAIIAKAEGR